MKFFQYTFFSAKRGPSPFQADTKMATVILKKKGLLTSIAASWTFGNWSTFVFNEIRNKCVCLIYRETVYSKECNVMRHWKHATINEKLTGSDHGGKMKHLETLFNNHVFFTVFFTWIKWKYYKRRATI